MLETLLTAQGAVVSSEELLDRVWDENADPFTTTVRVTMMTLRRKLGEPAIIDTVVGSGYRIDPAALACRERRGGRDRRREAVPPDAAHPHGVAVRRTGPARRRVRCCSPRSSCSTGRSRNVADLRQRPARSRSPTTAGPVLPARPERARRIRPRHDAR